MEALDGGVTDLANTYPADERGLALFRITYALSFILLASPRFLWTVGYPDLFWDPPLPLSLFDCSEGAYACVIGGFPPLWVTVLLEVLLALSAVFLLFGYRTFYASVLFSVFFVTLNTFRFSFGKIDHGIMFVVTPAILSLSGWGNHFSIDAQRQRGGKRSYPSYCLLVLALALAAGFLSAGLPKAIGWLDFDLRTSGVRKWAVWSYYSGWLAPVLLKSLGSYLWEIADWLVVLFELGLAMAAFHGPLFKRFIALAVFFHIANHLVLGISTFWVHFPVYAAFLPWTQVAKQIGGTKWEERLSSVFDVRALLIFSLLFLPYYFFVSTGAILGFVGIGVQGAKALPVYGVALLTIGYLLLRRMDLHAWEGWEPAS